jgi:hypothetical protein
MNKRILKMSIKQYWEETKALLKNNVEQIQRREQGVGSKPMEHPEITAMGVGALVNKPKPAPFQTPKPVAFPEAKPNVRALGVIEEKPNQPSINVQQHERLRDTQRKETPGPNVPFTNKSVPAQRHSISMSIAPTQPNEKPLTVNFNKLVDLNNLDEAIRNNGFDKTKSTNAPLDKMTTDRLFQAANIPVDYLMKLHSELARNIEAGNAQDNGKYPSVQTTSHHMLHNLKHLIASKIYHIKKPLQNNLG